MFLAGLEKENREAFLELCSMAIMVNGEYADEEKAVLMSYCHEMGIESDGGFDEERVRQAASKDINTVVEQIYSKTNKKERSIIMVELLGLVKSDHVYDEFERKFINSVAEGLRISEDKIKLLSSLIEVYVSVCTELSDAVFN